MSVAFAAYEILYPLSVIAPEVLVIVPAIDRLALNAAPFPLSSLKLFSDVIFAGSVSAAGVAAPKISIDELEVPAIFPLVRLTFPYN